MTGISGVTWQQQEGLFGDSGPQPGAEPVLMALHAEYYQLIWQGLKTHEFRRRFLEGRPARWYSYARYISGAGEQCCETQQHAQGQIVHPRIVMRVSDRPTAKSYAAAPTCHWRAISNSRL